MDVAETGQGPAPDSGLHHARREDSRAKSGASGAALLGMLALVLLPALLRGGWVLDDRELLFGNPVTSGAASWTQAFARDYFHHLGGSGAWRPLASLSLRLDRWLFGEWVTGYHLVNGLLHIGVVTLALVCTRSLGWTLRQIALGVIVFALHPLLMDSVVWISGRTSMLSALFPLAGLVSYQLCTRTHSAHVVAILPLAIGLGAGMLAKEDALVFAPLMVLVAARTSRRRALVALAAISIVCVVWGCGRGWALGAPWPRAATPVLPHASLLERLELGGASVLEALRLGLLPANYPPQFRADFLLERWKLASGVSVAWGGWLLLGAPWVVLAKRRCGAGPMLWSAALAALAFLPVSHLVPFGEAFAPRFAYLPLLFLVPFFGGIGERVFVGRSLWVVVIVAALVLGALSFERAGVYADRGAWRNEMLRHHPKDAPSWNDIGLYREEQGDVLAAREAWQRASECDPSYSKAWSNLGRSRLVSNDLPGAESALREAIRVGPRNPIAHVNLGTTLVRSGRPSEAVEAYAEATRLAPGLGPAWRGLGQALAAAGEASRARVALERALRLDPKDAIAQALLDKLPRTRTP